MDPSSHRRHTSMSTPRKSSESRRSRTVERSLIAPVPGPSSTPEQASTSSRTSRKSVMTSVRRSLSVSAKKSHSKSKSSSSVDEPNYTTSRFRRDDPSFSPPTVEQIAMGLHLSRTPHLRGNSANQFHPHPPPFPRSTSLTLPPPPARSAMKKTHVSSGSNPGLTAQSASSTTFTSLSTPHSSNTVNSMSFLSFKGLSRLIVGPKSPTTPFAPSSLAASSTSSSRASVSDIDLPPKKAVRFFVDAHQSSNALDDE